MSLEILKSLIPVFINRHMYFMELFDDTNKFLKHYEYDKENLYIKKTEQKLLHTISENKFYHIIGFILSISPYSIIQNLRKYIVAKQIEKDNK